MAKKATGRKAPAKSRKTGTAARRSPQRRKSSKTSGLLARFSQRPVLIALALGGFAILATAILSLIGGRDSLPTAMVEPPPVIEPATRPATKPAVPQAPVVVPEVSRDAMRRDIPLDPPPLTDVPPRSSTSLVQPPVDRPTVPEPRPVPERPVVMAPPPVEKAAPNKPQADRPQPDKPGAGKPPSGDDLRRNAVPTPPIQGKPAIAIVIDDMGVDARRSKGIAALPGPLTLAWLPYARDLKSQASAARARGHELMLHIPMEPSGSADPGPDALKVGLGEDEIIRRTRKALTSFDGFVGVNNHMGSRFTADRTGMAPVMKEFKQRNLLWLDSRTTAKTVGPVLAREMRVPHLGRDVFLDNVQTVTAIKKQLSETETIARKRGMAIAIGHPYDATIKALADWLPDARRRGFAIVPVSAMLRAAE